MARSIPQLRTGPVATPRVQPLTRPSGSRLGPRPVTLLDYTNPRRQARSLAQSERALSRSDVVLDPRSRTLYEIPSRAEVDREVRAFQQGSAKRRREAARRLDRWGLTTGRTRVKRLGVVVPDPASLKVRDQVLRDGRVTDVMEARDGSQWIRRDGRLVPYRRQYRGPGNGLEWLGEVAEKVGRMRGPSRTGSGARVGGVTVFSTVPPGGAAKSVKAGQTFAGRVLADALNIPAQAIPSTYELTAAAFEAARGDTKRARRLWDQYKRTGVLPALLSGDLEGFVKRLAKHPLAGALELRGGQVILTRNAARGAVHGARVGAKAGRVARGRRRAPGRVERIANEILSTRRGEEVPGVGFVQPRTRGRQGEGATYSRDLAVKTWQVARDRRRRKRAGKEGRPASILSREDIDAAVRGGVDHAEGVSELLRREGVAEVERLAKKFPEKYALVGRLILEGEVRPGRMREDLVKVRDELREHSSRLEGEKLDQHMRNLAQVEAALSDKALLRGEHKAFAKLREYADGLNAIDAQLAASGYRAAETGKSKHVPWLVRHADARAGTRADAVLTPAGKVRGSARTARTTAEEGVTAARVELRAAEQRLARIREVEARTVGSLSARAAMARRRGLGRGPRTDLTRRQGEQLMAVRADRMGAERRVQAARKAYGEAQLRAREAKASERAARAETRGRPEKHVPWMVDRQGREITDDRIPALAREHGVDIDGIAWISQRSFELSERGRTTSAAISLSGPA